MCITRESHAGFCLVAEITQKCITEVFGHLDEMEERDGGAYFCRSDNDGTPVHTVLIGPVSRGFRRRYHDNAEKKGMEVARMYQFAAHRLSRESADAELGHYPGGIFLGNGVGGFQISGYPGDVDECGAVAMAYAIGYISLDYARTFLLRQNPHKELGMQLCERVKQECDRATA